jgi:hypothetical protein
MSDLTEDEWAPYNSPDDAARLRAEDDLRIRMFALDMAVTALPSLSSKLEPEEYKLGVIRRAAAEFEKILRGDEVG